MTHQMLDGPRLPAASGKAASLVVLLHGYGADGNDLIELGAQWRRLLPDTAFAAPHAPTMIPGFPPGMGGGRQWFALDAYDPNLLRRDPSRLPESTQRCRWPPKAPRRRCRLSSMPNLRGMV